MTLRINTLKRFVLSLLRHAPLIGVWLNFSTSERHTQTRYCGIMPKLRTTGVYSCGRRVRFGLVLTQISVNWTGVTLGSSRKLILEIRSYLSISLRLTGSFEKLVGLLLVVQVR